MATSSTAVVVTEGQSTLLRSFIDQVNGFKFNNPNKKINKLVLTYNAADNTYAIDLDETPITSTE